MTVYMLNYFNSYILIVKCIYDIKFKMGGNYGRRIILKYFYYLYFIKINNIKVV